MEVVLAQPVNALTKQLIADILLPISRLPMIYMSDLHAEREHPPADQG
jgi:hypothetical protein